MKIGRFVFDGHIHCGKKDEMLATSEKKGIWAEVVGVDNSDMILFDMDVYGVDMGLLLPSMLGTTNTLHKEIVKRHPTRFRSCCMDSQTRLRAAHGEKEWNINDAVKELDDVLTADPDVFVGIGEFAPGCMGTVRKPCTSIERYEEYSAIAEVAIAHDVPMYFHEHCDNTGIGRQQAFHVLGKVINEKPDFKVIIAHGGGDTPTEIQEACNVAAYGDNVYLETGYWRAEYYEMALKDYMLSAARLLWGGGDTGSRLWYPQATRRGMKFLEPTKVIYNKNNWVGDHREADYQPDYYGWAMHQVKRLLDLDLATQDEINLIVGGNAARLYKLPVPKYCTFACNRPDLKIK